MEYVNLLFIKSVEFMFIIIAWNLFYKQLKYLNFFFTYFKLEEINCK